MKTTYGFIFFPRNHSMETKPKVSVVATKRKGVLLVVEWGKMDQHDDERSLIMELFQKGELYPHCIPEFSLMWDTDLVQWMKREMRRAFEDVERMNTLTLCLGRERWNVMGDVLRYHIAGFILPPQRVLNQAYATMYYQGLS